MPPGPFVYWRWTIFLPLPSSFVTVRDARFSSAPPCPIEVRVGAHGAAGCQTRTSPLPGTAASPVYRRYAPSLSS